METQILPVSTTTPSWPLFDDRRSPIASARLQMRTRRARRNPIKVTKNPGLIDSDGTPSQCILRALLLPRSRFPKMLQVQSITSTGEVNLDTRTAPNLSLGSKLNVGLHGNLYRPIRRVSPPQQSTAGLDLGLHTISQYSPLNLQTTAIHCLQCQKTHQRTRLP